jgi:hypothetical protein
MSDLEIKSLENELMGLTKRLHHVKTNASPCGPKDYDFRQERAGVGGGMGYTVECAHLKSVCSCCRPETNWSADAECSRRIKKAPPMVTAK